MAVEETNIVHAIQLMASKLGHRLFKNVRGSFLTPDGKQRISAGMQPKGSSDLVGYTSVLITPAMVGRRLPVLTCVEVKTATGRASTEQEAFIGFVRTMNGIAGVARSDAEYERLIHGWLSEMG